MAARFNWRGAVDSARLAFERLTQREQTVVFAGAGAAVFLILLAIGLLVSGAIGRAESRVRLKDEQLTEVMQLQGDYKTRQAERDARMRELGGGNIRLVSLVEETARQAGVEIGQLKPDDSEPNADGIIESRVDLKATNLSADRLTDFLERLENARGLVITRRLKIQRPYRRDTVDLDLTITTYKKKP